MDMKERLQELAENARKRIEESEGLDKLNDVRVAVSYTHLTLPTKRIV